MILEVHYGHMGDTVNITASNAAKVVALGDVATLRAGYSFRTAIAESKAGGVLAVQLRDVQPGEQPKWSSVIQTSLAREPSDGEWLRPGDILFTFRGARYFAVVLEKVPAAAVAATQFMLLRVRDTGVLLPTFLAWQLNQPPAQTYLAQAASGTAQRSLRRAVIEALAVAIPTLAVQQSVVEVATLARRERFALEELVRVREQQLDQIAASLLATAAAKGPE